MPIVLEVALTAILVLIVGGLFLGAPGVAILLVILLSPVMFAMWVSRPRPGGPRTASGPRSIAATLGIIIAAGVAGTIAFFGACFAGGWAGVAGAAPGTDELGVGVRTGIITGSLAGSTVAVLILRKLWRSPK